MAHAVVLDTISFIGLQVRILPGALWDGLTAGQVVLSHLVEVRTLLPKQNIQVFRRRIHGPALEAGVRRFESYRLDCDCSITVNAPDCDLGYGSSILLSHLKCSYSIVVSAVGFQPKDQSSILCRSTNTDVAEWICVPLLTETIRVRILSSVRKLSKQAGQNESSKLQSVGSIPTLLTELGVDKQVARTLHLHCEGCRFKTGLLHYIEMQLRGRAVGC